MTQAIGIRREDKNRWERRAPLTPAHVERLVRDHGMEVFVQPSSVRVFAEEAYRKAGATVQEDLSLCSFVFGVKEIPAVLFQPGKAYFFFSHTIKGQPHNMPMLKAMMENGCHLIDYERIVDDRNRRLVLFGRHAGLAGMVESLHALGLRLSAEGLEESKNPFKDLRQPYQYRDLNEAKEHLRAIGNGIRRNGLPTTLVPFVVGFLGYGNVSRGAQEILDCLPVQEVSPERLSFLAQGALSDKTVYKVVFGEKETVEAVDGSPFSLEHYWQHPELYRATFARALPHLSVLINGIYWDERYPVLVSRDAIKELYSAMRRPSLRIIGDITCDLEGSIAITRKATLPDEPCYVYDAVEDAIHDGVHDLPGPVVMAVDILPTEFPVESSSAFGDSLLPFLPDIAASDMTGSFSDCSLPAPIKRAVILYQGRLTESYRYLEKYLV